MMMKFQFRILFLVPSLMLSLFSVQDAMALTALKQVQVTGSSQVDLLFDGKVNRNQIKTEFFNDVIQISLTDVSVYPAKISSVSGGYLTKIFAYQYAPKLVRCRLSVKGKAEAFRDKIAVTSGGPNGKMLTIRLDGGKSAQASAQAQVAKNPKSDDAEINQDERVLLEKVTNNSAPAFNGGNPANTDQITAKAAAPIAAPGNGSPALTSLLTEDKPIAYIHESAHEGGRPETHLTGGAKNLPSPVNALGKLALVVGLFSLVALGVKKFVKTAETGNDNALFGALSRFARKNLGVKSSMNKPTVVILTNHHLGPKKSIAVIKVAGRTMVVGITDQSINLISQLASDEDAMNAMMEFDNPPLEEQPVRTAPEKAAPTTPATGATAAGPVVFSKLLQSEATKPSVSTPVINTKKDVRVTAYGSNVSGGVTGVSMQAAVGLSGVRAQIKNKLEGLKQI
jgi:flagellar biogenesis protein FliO